MLSRRDDERLTVHRNLVRPRADDRLGALEDQFKCPNVGPPGLQHEFMAELSWMVQRAGRVARALAPVSDFE